MYERINIIDDYYFEIDHEIREAKLFHNQNEIRTVPEYFLDISENSSKDITLDDGWAESGNLNFVLSSGKGVINIFFIQSNRQILDITVSKRGIRGEVYCYDNLVKIVREARRSNQGDVSVYDYNGKQLFVGESSLREFYELGDFFACIISNRLVILHQPYLEQINTDWEIECFNGFAWKGIRNGLNYYIQIIGVNGHTLLIDRNGLLFADAHGRGDFDFVQIEGQTTLIHHERISFSGIKINDKITIYNPISGNYLYSLEAPRKVTLPYDGSKYDSWDLYSGLRLQNGFNHIVYKEYYGMTLKGIVDHSFRCLVNPCYESINPVDGTDFLIVSNNEKYGIVSTHNEVLVPIVHDKIIPKYGKFFLITTGGQVELFSKELNRIQCLNYPTKHIGIVDSNVPSRFIVTQEIGENRVSGVIDIEGHVIIPLQYDSIKYFESWCFQEPKLWLRVRKGQYVGLYHDSNLVLEPVYEKISLRQDDYFKCRFIIWSNNKCGVFDPSVESVIVPPQYDEIHFKNKWFILNMNGFLGLSENTGNMILPPIYSDIQCDEGKIFRLCINGMWGYFQIDSRKMSSFEYSSAEPFLDGIARVQRFDSDEKYLVSENLEKIVFAEGYEVIEKEMAYDEDKGEWVEYECRCPYSIEDEIKKYEQNLEVFERGDSDSNEDSYHVYYSSEELEDMRLAAYEGDPEMFWNND